jgi:hypothetical protein
VKYWFKWTGEETEMIHEIINWIAVNVAALADDAQV